MKYLDFKNAYLFKQELKSNLNPIQNTLFSIQRKFDDYYLNFFLDSNYSSALVYNNLLTKFIKLIENSSLDRKDVVSRALSIFKELIIKNNAINSYTRNIKLDFKKNDDYYSHSA